MLAANLKKNASDLIGRNFIMQQDSDPNHTANTTQDFIRGKRGNIFSLAKSTTRPY